MPPHIKSVIVDGGYRGEVITEVFKKFGYILQIVLGKGNVKGDFKPIRKQWNVERTIS